MKFLRRTFLKPLWYGSLVLLALLGAPLQAELVLDEAIVFGVEDFEGLKSKARRWTINPRDGAPTRVWSMTNARIAPKGGDARLSILSNLDPSSEIVWKIETPEKTRIAGFEWGVAQVFLDSPFDSRAQFFWEYSLDGVEWVEFFSTENRKNANGGPTSLTNQVFRVDVEAPSGNTLFLRARNAELEATGASSYYAIFSSYPDGGESSASFVSVVLAE